MLQPETDVMLKNNLKPEMEDFLQIIYEMPTKAQQSMHDFLQGAEFMMNISRGLKGDDAST